MMNIFDDAGAGQAIVFLHAGLTDRRMWRPQLEAFAETNRVIAIDSPGFGQALPPTDPFNRADEIIAVLEHLAIDSAVFVGTSLGGRIAAEIAVVYPERVQGLMLICAARAGHDWSDAVQQMWEQEADALEAGDIDAAVHVNLDFWLDGPDRDQAALSDSDRALVAEMQRRTFELELAHPDAASEIRRTDIADRTCEIAVPTQVLFGSEDVADIAEIARWYVDQIADARLNEVADAAHLPSLEQPEVCNSLLRELLSLTS